MIIRSLSILLALVFGVHEKSFAQDGVFCLKSIKLKILPIQHEDSLIRMDFFQFGWWDDHQDGRGKSSHFVYDEPASTYTFNYSYTDIGGGSMTRLKCPSIFLQISFSRFINHHKEEYYKIIPLVFEITKTSDLSFFEYTIDLHDALTKEGTCLLFDEVSSYTTVMRDSINELSNTYEFIPIVFAHE